MLVASPATSMADDVFVYSSANSFYGLNLTAKQDFLLTTVPFSSSVNALAVNPSNGLVYYGEGSNIYYWDPALGSGSNAHILINNFASGSMQAPINNLDSGGGAFLDGKYYLGSETADGFVEDLYEISLSSDGRSVLSVQALDIYSACACTSVQLGGLGDLTVLNEGGPVIYGSTSDITTDNQGDLAGFWLLDIAANEFTQLSTGNGGQLARGLDQRVYTNVGTSIRELNTSTGSVSSNSLMNTSQEIYDFTGGYSYDFGDAPSSYGAAMHIVDSTSQSVYVGSAGIDNEAGSLNSSASKVDGLGDDQTGIDDENAFTVLDSLVVGESEYKISLQCSSGFVSSWIDFNLNGVFDTAERNTNHPVSCSSQAADLVWSGISIPTTGASYLRVRTASKLSDIADPVGIAQNGEVEDHEISFVPADPIAASCPAGTTSHLYYPSDVPLAYGIGFAGGTFDSVINVPDQFVIEDLNIIDLEANHNRLDGLVFNLYRGFTTTKLYGTAYFGNPCSSNTDFKIGFDDEAAQSVACPAVNGTSYIPDQALSVHDGTNSQGEWRLRVNNTVTGSRGTLENWGLQICAIDGVVAGPDIRLGKEVEVTDRTVNVVLMAKNTGTTPLNNVQLTDDLDAVFGAGNYSISSPPVVLAPAFGFTANPNFTGASSPAGLNQPVYSGGSLQPGQELQVTFNVDVGFNGWRLDESYENQALITSTDPAGNVFTDLSALGFDFTTDRDEPTPINMDYRVEFVGAVFEDTSNDPQTSHDGIQQSSESGVSGRVVRIIDVNNNLEIAKTTTDGDGAWTVLLNPFYNGKAVKVVVDSDSESDFASESPLQADESTTDGSVTVIATSSQQEDPSNNVINIGVVPVSSLASSQESAVTRGEKALYAHTFNAATHGSVDFKIDTESSSQSTNWIVSIYRDNNCNQQIEAQDALFNGAAVVAKDDKLCIIIVVEASINAVPGDQQNMTLTASFTLSDAAATGLESLLTAINQNQTTVEGTKEGDLVLEKTVTNLTLGGQAVSSNAALPGHTLLYTIDYINLGLGPIVDLVIKDDIPAFTQVESNSIQCDQTPSAMSCLGSASNAQIDWIFQGDLQVGAQGSVSYRVTVE